MAKQFHIIIKTASVNSLFPVCPVKLVLKDTKKREKLNISLNAANGGYKVFHAAYTSSKITKIDAIEFYLASGSESDSLLLDCVEVVDLTTKSHKHFPCNQWVTNTPARNISDVSVPLKKESTRRHCFEIIRGKDKQYYFRLRSGNSEIIAQSEGYKSKASAVKGIKAMRNVIPSALIYDLSITKSNNN